MRSSAQNKIRSISYAKYGYMFILPFFIIYFIFQLFPLFNTFKLSLYGNGDAAANTFVGLQNFSDLITGDGNLTVVAQHKNVIRVFQNTIILWFGNFIPQLALSLLLAVWFTDINLKIKGKTFFKIIMYLPNIVTAASVAALFLMLFSKTKYGPINSMLMNIGMEKPIDFVRNEWNSRFVIMFAQTWMWFGNTMIMLMAAIMGISPSLFEAADIDGANSRQVFTRITVPLLRPMVIYVMITSMIGGLQMWDLPYLYKEGTTYNRYTETIAVYIYNHFHNVPHNYGYSAAASVLLFIVTAALGSICFIMNIDKDAVARKKQIKEAKKQMKMQRKSSFGGF